MMESDLEKLKKKRTVLRTLTTKLLNKIESIYSDDTIILDDKLEQLKDLKAQLMEKDDNLKLLNEKIEDLIENVEMEQEITTSEEYAEKVIKWKSRIGRLEGEKDIVLNENKTSDSPHNNHNDNIRQTSEPKLVKLPKLTIAKFYGEPSVWLDFWSQFQNAIHENKNLSEAHKFNYLKSLLGGVALNAIKGFALTSENYNKSVELLRERFGRNDIVINSHMNKILNLEPVKSSSNIKALRNLYDELEINIRSLESLKVVSGSYGHLLCPILLKLIPEDISLDYNRKRKSRTEFDVKELIEFIKTEVECREASNLINDCKKSKGINFPTNFRETNKKNFNRSTPTVATFSTNVHLNCIFCKANHNSYNCEATTASEKRSKLKNEGRCFKCLRKSHLSYECRAKVHPCKICNSKAHHTSLCLQNPRSLRNENETAGAGESSSDSRVCEAELQTVVSNISYLRKGRQESKLVYLQTCNARLYATDVVKNVTVLFDTASMRSFITRDLAERCNLPIIRKEHLFVYTFGNKEPSEKVYNVVKLKLGNIECPSKSIEIEVLVTNSITNAFIPTPNKFIQKLLESKQIFLPDLSLSQRDKNVNVLIGADYYWKVHTGKIKKLNKDLVCVETLFGWTVTGTYCNDSDVKGVVENLCLCARENIQNDKLYIREAETCSDVNTQLKLFWDIESLGITDGIRDIPSETEQLRKFEEKIEFKNNRYEVRLPFKEKVDISDNYLLCKRRLFNLRQRLKGDLSLYKNYANVFKEQLERGIIELVDTDSKTSNYTYYMPHHPVIRQDKETTKLRIVFDASAKEKNCLSLNDNLHTGPNMNPNLLTLLLKFRENKVAIIADIERAFLQVSLAEEDRDCQRFLWFDQLSSDKLTVYRNKTVTFGVKSSPFLLAATIKFHIKNYENLYPRAYRVLNEQLYVDDLICGTNTDEEAINLSNETKLILKDASMNLRKWKSNSKELSNIWQDSKREDIPDEESVQIKVLGIIWNTSTDEFKLDLSPLINSLENAKNTKRSILQLSCKLFDPMGIISAFTIRIKILLQEIWERGLDWDRNLPEDLKNKWAKWCSEVPTLEKLSIPRFYFHESNDPNSRELQIHIFCDASEAAYGAIAYIRFKTKYDEFNVKFVTSKARVAPLKKLSLPRLELMATLIGARLLNTLKEIFKVGDNYILWTDSTVALGWIQGSAKRWKPFVCNRVSEIQELADPQNWKYCRGAENPADIISRGCSAEELLRSQKLWNGPQWLKLPEIQWPSNEEMCRHELINEEMRANYPVAVNLTTEENKKEFESILCLKNFSSLTKVYRITAWVRRFINNLKLEKENRISSPLTAEEIEDAKVIWIKKIQENAYFLEIQCLKEGKPIPKDSKIRDLNPFLDGKGVLLVGGRLQQAKLDFHQKHPMIVPSKTKFSELIVRRAHESVLHSGIADTLVEVRENFWIPKCRQFIKSVLRKCIICKRYSASPGSQVIAPLPGDRINQSPPFAITGLDFAGPLYVKNSEDKFYILLCTCAVTRALHLELVTNLTTEVFLLAFRRFISRRGLCSVIYSDNAKTFKRAEQELRKVWEIISHPDVKNYYATQGIKWKYIVEKGAWWGGFYERMVRSVKTILRKTVGKTSLAAEELETVLTEIEAVINSRPITYVHEDFKEPFPLTPAHFLLGRRIMNLPAVRVSNVKDFGSTKVLINRFNYREKLLDRFWKMWTKDYLLNLKSANSVKPEKNRDFKINDIVLIHEERLPRNLWRLGKVIETFVGRDGKIRACTVKTEHSIIKRPIQLLYNLELHE